MTRFFLDTEFNAYGGALLSLGIACQDGTNLYLIEEWARLNSMRSNYLIDPWVDEHVMPFLMSVPEGVVPIEAPVREWGAIISGFIYRGDEIPQVFADWPSDIADFCNLLITGPGTAVTMKQQTHMTILRHIDVYPTSLPDAVQHNAMWDALALKRWVEEQE